MGFNVFEQFATTDSKSGQQKQMIEMELEELQEHYAKEKDELTKAIDGLKFQREQEEEQVSDSKQGGRRILTVER